MEQYNYTIIERRPVASEKSDIGIVFFPGNPGIIEMYEQFIDLLSHSLERKVHVIGMCHIGHDGCHKKALLLREQVETKELLIKKLIKEEGLKRFIFVGHSVGVWIMLKTCYNLLPVPQFEIMGLFGLCPAILDLDYGMPFYVKLDSVTQYIALNFLSLLVPPKLVIPLLNLQHLNNASGLLSYPNNYYALKNVLALGKDEIVVIRKEIDHHINSIFHKELKGMEKCYISLLYCKVDRYVAPEHFAKISNNYPNIDRIDKLDLRHAFVMYPDNVKVVVDSLRSQIVPLLE